MSEIIIAALYQFVRLPDYQVLRAPLLQTCINNQVKGTILLAEEGINGTIAGTREGIASVVETIRADKRFSKLEYKESVAQHMPFHRTKVKLKKEIVSMGVPGTDPNHTVGTYLNAEQWNALLDDPDLVLIDTRNDYEVQIGSFENAQSPETTSFREFPDFVKAQLAANKKSKIAMFCTGGIRCEKATSYLKSQGFENVFHLQGGILRYLETTDPEASRWQGECFVFDGRVSVDKDLQPGSYAQCHACRRPVSEQDQTSEHYRPGVSCPHCIDIFSDRQREAFAERQRQVELANARGQQHIGLSLQPNARG